MGAPADPSDVVVVGTGFGGLCAAAKLKGDGLAVTVLEKADEVGGTWRENTYPGAECDVPSALYSYSFAPNPTWDHKWAKQPQILAYLRRFADEAGVRPLIRFGQTVRRAVWDEGARRWWVETQDMAYEARHLILALGQLHHPMTPEIEGSVSYTGRAFHAARWDHGFDPAGKRVGVVGSAASAIQLVPELAEVAGCLTVYQRSPNWVLPKGDRPYTKVEQALGARVPALARAYRAGLWSMGEYGLYPMIQGRRMQARLGEALCRRAIRRHVADPAMRAALVPDYPIGAKRILLSDRYYPALARPNTELVTDPIERMTEHGLVAGGTERAHDAVVFATGFRTNPFVPDIEVMGAGGRRLREHWAGGAHAYLGVQTAGFPNLFMLYGPNTNTGHTSIVYKLEAQVGMVRKLIRAAGEGAVTVRAKAEETFNDEMQSRLAGLAWSKIDASWYQDRGRITNNWPGPSREYRQRCERVRWGDFEVRGDGDGAGGAVVGVTA